MKKVIASALLAAGMVAALPAMASADLARANGCIACHSADKRMVGPSYQEIAARYKGQAGAAKQLAEKIRKGSVGVWGKIPMPPNPRVTAADADTLARWSLAGGR